MRFGFFPESLKEKLRKTNNIWVHAVSVGEVLVILRLIDLIRKELPRFSILLSTVTKTGYDLGRCRLKPEDTVVYAPLDFSLIVQNYIRLIRPKIYITAETEIWPNLFYGLNRRGVPIVQVNGRISDKSFKGYRKFSIVIRRVLKAVSFFCMQSELDAQRIKSLGADENKVAVVGNLKFDDLTEARTYTVEDIGLSTQDKVWIAGSTHPGEEELILRIFRKISAEFSNFRLIIAPRHIERTTEVSQLVAQAGFTPVEFSKIKEKEITKNSIIVVDTIGHLRSLYSVADIVFIGKSLVKEGGQNMIEPAFFAKPIVVGPHMQNFKDIMKIFLEAKAIIQINNEQALEHELIRFLENPEDMASIGKRGKDIVQKNQGATARTLKIIKQHLMSP